jgi:hypothetical protein
MENTESAPEAQPEKQTRKTLFMVIGFLAALGLLIALNMK